MKSIQTKIIFLSLFCTLLAAVVVLCAGFYNTKSILDEDSVQIMNLLGESKTLEINETIHSIEQTVDTLYQFVLSQTDDVNRLITDEEYYNSYLQKIRELSENAAENTAGSIGVYLHFNPELFAPTDGFYMIKPTGTEHFIDHEVTDLSKYEKTDISNTGWYYQPMEAGKPIWMNPYKNANVGTEVISYVIPIYCQGTELGIIGMDIDMKILCDRVDEISVYETGYGFLMGIDGNVVYHQDCINGLQREDYEDETAVLAEMLRQGKKESEASSYCWKGIEKQLTYNKLHNGMYLVITVPTQEIATPQWVLVRSSLVMIVFVMLLSVFLVNKWVRTLIRPLKQLTDAARKLEMGDMNITIECKSKDEVGVLARSFQQMAKALKEYMEYMNQLAYTDAMTGLMNKAAYKKLVATLSKKIEEGKARFVIIVLDINNLKKINDTYGHEKGDSMIIAAANLMRETFGVQVFRVGGDEFVTILQNRELPKYKELMQRFENNVDKFNSSQEKIKEYVLQIALGAAVFENEKDKSYMDVFRRADALMYENKHWKKSRT